MHTCSQCYFQSPDEAKLCMNCGADLSEFSQAAEALKRFRSNPRVKMVRLVIMHDACPACQQIEGTYPKDSVPALPAGGCSHNLGCRCFYQPFLDDIYP